MLFICARKGGGARCREKERGCARVANSSAKTAGTEEGASPNDARSKAITHMMLLARQSPRWKILALSANAFTGNTGARQLHLRKSRSMHPIGLPSPTPHPFLSPAHIWLRHGFAPTRKALLLHPRVCSAHSRAAITHSGRLRQQVGTTACKVHRYRDTRRAPRYHHNKARAHFMNIVMH